MIKKPLPSRFYKYICWKSKYSRRILLQNCIYFSSPKNFNDPFDCSLSIRYDEKTKKQILKDYKTSLKGMYPTYDSRKIDEVALEIQQSNPNLHDKITRDTIERNRDTIYKNIGVFSVSEKDDNFLMWSHYCDSHKGICIGFDANKLFWFLNTSYGIACSPLKYKSKYPIIRPKWVDQKIGEIILTNKAKYWSYEKEWRFILSGETDKEVILPDGIIVEVCIGCNTQKNHTNKIIEILKTKETKIELKEAYPNNREFKLDFRKISY